MCMASQSERLTNHLSPFTLSPKSMFRVHHPPRHGQADTPTGLTCSLHRRHGTWPYLDGRKERGSLGAKFAKAHSGQAHVHAHPAQPAHP